MIEDINHGGHGGDTEGYRISGLKFQLPREEAVEAIKEGIQDFRFEISNLKSAVPSPCLLCLR